MSFRNTQKEKFTEIDVEKINIVEKDGKVKMVIANKRSLPDPVTNGHVLYESKEGRGPGIIIYNDDGDEVGGYVFGNWSVHFSMDQHKQDQIVYMQVLNNEKGKPHTAGYWVAPKSYTLTSDVMDKMLDSIYAIGDKAKRDSSIKKFWQGVDSHTKTFMGKTREDNTGLFLFDKDFHTRLRVFVDAAGNPKIQFLDKKGKVNYSIPK